MAKVRLEWVRLNRTDFQRGAVASGLASFQGQQTFTVSAASVSSSAAPAFPGRDGSPGSEGMARISVISGAVVVTWGPSPVASESAGIRLQVGQTQLISVDTGDVIAFVEAADPPAPGAVQDAAAETSLSAIQSAVQAPLAVLASPIHAVAVAHSGALTLAGVAQDLMPANAARNGWSIQNQSNSPLYLRSKGAGGTTLATLDQNSLLLPPGAAYDPPKITPHALSIVGAAAGQAFFAEEW